MSFVALAVVSVVAAAPPSARLASPAPPLVVGQGWAATVFAHGGRPTVRARLERSLVSFRPTPAGRDRYRVVLHFPRAGTWSLSALVGRRELPLGRVAVAASYLLAQPAGTLVLPDGSVFVCERGSKNRVLRIDPGSGRFGVFATGTLSPFALARAPDGSILVAGDAGIFRIPPGGGRATTFSAVAASPIAFAPNGDLYYAHFLELGRIPAGARTAERLPAEVNFPHGSRSRPGVPSSSATAVTAASCGWIPAPDVRRSSPPGCARRWASSFDPSGNALVLEFETHSLLRIGEDGRKTVARGLSAPYALARAENGAVYVGETGSVSLATGTLDTVAPDGSVSRIRLLPRG